MQRISLEALARQQLEAAGRAHGGHAADTVYGGREKVLRQTVIGLVKGASLAEHENPGNATVQVLRGRVRLSSGDLSWEARSGDMRGRPRLGGGRAVAARPNRHRRSWRVALREPPGTSRCAAQLRVGARRRPGLTPQVTSLGSALRTGSASSGAWSACETTRVLVLPGKSRLSQAVDQPSRRRHLADEDGRAHGACLQHELLCLLDRLIRHGVASSFDERGAVKMSGEDERPMVSVSDAREVYRMSLRAHRAELDGPNNGPEWLEEASCPPDVKKLAMLASSASVSGMTSEGWRAMLMSEGGREALPLLDTAETCMRESGLWPWNQA